MNLQVSKKMMVLILIIIVTIGLLVGSYFYFLYPLKTEVKTLKDQLSTEEKLYDTLAQQVGKEKTTVLENSRYLQKRLPVESFLEQFMLDLERAEVVSNSLIEDMTFQDSEVTENDIIIENPKDQGQNSGDGQNQEEEANQKDTNEQGQEATESPSLPNGIKRVTVNMTVTSKDYYDLQKFLDTIENFERVTKIDSLTLQGGKEILSLDDEIKELTYTVVLSTFYYPKLEELKNELPVFDVPPPSNKDNPLPTGMYYKDDEKNANVDKKGGNPESVVKQIVETIIEDSKSPSQEKQNTSKAETTTETKVIKKLAPMGGNLATSAAKKNIVQDSTGSSYNVHTVKQGETLYSISIEKLHANRVDDIMKLNHLQSDQLQVGQQLKIPNE